MSNGPRGVEERIKARYHNVVIKKRNVSFNLDEELLERLDAVVERFKEKDGETNRNNVIEEAISVYVESAEDYFGGEDEKNDKQLGEVVKEDTVIYPSTNDNFVKFFIGLSEWHYVRMADFRISEVKYLALYRGTPVSAITHYAEIVKVGEKNSSGKRRIELKEPIELPSPIKLGDIHVNNVRKHFYTTLDKLQQATTVEELIK